MRTMIDSAIGSIEGAMLVAREELIECFDKVKAGDRDYVADCQRLMRELDVLDGVLHELQEFKRAESGEDRALFEISNSDYS